MLADEVLNTPEQAIAFGRRLGKTIVMRKRPLRVRVSLSTNNASALQYRALFGVAYEVIGDATGYRKDELHDYYCRGYFGEKVFQVTMGEVVRETMRPIRTTTTNELGETDVIDAGDFANFYSFVQERAAQDIGVVVPDPDPKLRKVA